MTKVEDKNEEIVDPLSEAPAKPKKVAAPKMFKLTIAAEDSAEGRSDVFVGYNYHSYLIQRDKEVIVPEGVIEILRNTVVDTVGADKAPIKIPRFNLTVSAV